MQKYEFDSVHIIISTLWDMDPSYTTVYYKIFSSIQDDFNKKYSQKEVLIESNNKVIKEKISYYIISFGVLKFICTNSFSRQYFGDGCQLL
ncbi:hypothetical protein [Klebsiella phage phiKp_21]|nr:hypothetical protein [Klebsiella phage phiKp_21]